MDRTLAITLGILIACFSVVAGMLGYTAYTEYAYRSTITGTTSYLCTITTDGPLANVTFFVPVPVDRAGNSPPAASWSSKTIAGIPAGWEAVLFDTGKATLVKITTPAIIPPEGTSSARPFAIPLSSDSSVPEAIETRDPVNTSAMFRPVQGLEETACPPADGDARCFTFTTSMYAAYEAAPDTNVTLTSAITGKNQWNVFGPASNGYHAEASVTLHGGQHGWTDMNGRLTPGSGTYEYPGSR